jgi:hypothetical protein
MGTRLFIFRFQYFLQFYLNRALHSTSLSIYLHYRSYSNTTFIKFYFSRTGQLWFSSYLIVILDFFLDCQSVIYSYTTVGAEIHNILYNYNILLGL